MESAIPIIFVSSDSGACKLQREICRKTWGPLLRPEFRLLFVIGTPGLMGQEWRVEGDILRVRCADDAEEKLSLALKAVVGLFQFPWLFKSTEETAWLNPWEMNGYPFWRWDQVGVFNSSGDGMPTGGGYSLSYRAVHHVIQHWEDAPALAAGDARIGHLVALMPGATRLHEPFFQSDPAETDASDALPFYKRAEAGADPVTKLEDFHKTAMQYRVAGRQHVGYAAEATFTTAPADPYLQLGPVTPPEGFPWDGRIFIQIAAYREKDLLNTLRNLVAQARMPERLRFGICWQHDEADSLEEFMTDPRVRLCDVPWQEAKGLGWARRMTQQLYDGEEFTLQIDAHERFIEGWDEALIHMLAQTDSPKPFLSGFPKGFIPGEELPPPGEPSVIIASGFFEDGTLDFRGKYLPNSAQLKHPIPARFIAGGFFFTYGSHCTEVPYDPNIYFSDELTMAIRTYTHGYDLYHPHRHIAWHHYGREEEAKHWDDHKATAPDTDGAKSAGWLRKLRGSMQIQQLLGHEDWGIKNLGAYGFGTQRTLTEYERYAGLDFKHRRIHEDSLQGLPPPTSYEGKEVWDAALKFQPATRFC